MKNDLNKLDVWKLSVTFSKNIYRLVDRFPRSELYGIISQLTHATISISSNIAEGKGRFHRKEFIQFLFLARGSAYECISLLATAKELGYISVSEYNTYLSEIETINIKLNALIKYLKLSLNDEL
ncbi:MAG: S23 ribosomal protein [Berkelbacteria bacterium GW2011_GWA2_35_9]|uniref:S23 ribosomal protein n=1 Tax=Berkelbacteria bacterium GW2011_GWA2_35_9 TaxID=1618333 RepID=A0A0G0G8K9_9BACT|nr:MAG: S23 ribosomal protein [Berkelbacteria bacterium GW2011_GWA2_35_9]